MVHMETEFINRHDTAVEARTRQQETLDHYRCIGLDTRFNPFPKCIFVIARSGSHNLLSK